MSSLNQRAMLVSLDAHTWAARKTDHEINRDSAMNHGVNERILNTTRKLLDGCPEVKFLLSIKSESIRFIRKHCALWGDKQYLLPVSKYLQVTEGLSDRKRSFDDMLADLIRKYPDLVRDNIVNQNGLAKYEDYPTTAEVERKYSFEYNVYPIPDIEDIRISVSDSQMEQVRRDIEETAERSAKNAIQNMCENLREVTQKIVNRLADPDAVFHKTIINNAIQMCGIVREMNVLEDPNVLSFVEELEEELIGKDVETLRKDKDYRRKTQENAEKILEKMEAI